MRAPLRLAPALLVALPLALAATTAEAQPQQRLIRGATESAPQTGPAPALPGLAARRAPAPIPGDPAANLSPNAALFDAIARGDLGAARDAVGRGANPEARNALGLTPLDAAVDQGRHDIAFYLLSAREMARAPAPEPSAAATSLANPPPAQPRGTPAPSRSAQAAAATLAGASARTAAPTSARLWAGDGGAPRPEIGFLGFDAGRPDGAVPPAARGTRPGRG